MFMIYNLEAREQTPGDLWDDGAACAAHCKSLNEGAGRKLYQPRPAPSAPDIDWRAREQARLDDGIYLHPADSIRRVAPMDHYLHVSRDKPELLAYTASDEKGRRDLQTRASVASYLEKFAPGIDAETRDALALEHVAKFVSCDLLFATTADDVERVYTSYDSSESGLVASCMRHTSGAYHGECGEHPVRAYATDGGENHLAIAYMQNANGKTISRALCYPAGKVYSRVYGAARLHDLLKAAGYVKGSYYKDSDDAPDMIGARLAAINIRDDAYLMPYIDGDEGLRRKRIDGKTFFVMVAPGDANGEYDTKRTDGLSQALEDENSTYCERCEDSCDEDEARCVYTGTRNGRLTGEQTWCESCVNHNSFYCHGFNETVSDGIDNVEMGGETYCLAYAENNFSMCEHTDDWFDGASEEVIVNSRGHTETWCESAVEDDSFISRDGKRYANDMRDPESPDDSPWADGDAPDDVELPGKNMPANPDENQLDLAL